MKLQRLVSLSALTTFTMLVCTSVILYIVPQGRVAYWSDWHLLGLDKNQWSDLHTNLGFVFFIMIVFHLYFNWRPLINYLRNQARALVVFTGEFIFALLIALAVIAGTLWQVPPFSWVIDWGDSFKEGAARQYGEPPYGHAELSTFAAFARQTGIDAKSARAQLEANGVKIESMQQRVLDIAKANATTPKALYAMIKPRETAASSTLPERPAGGLGRRSLAEISKEYGLAVGEVVALLRRNGIEASADMSLREIAEQNAKAPYDVYGIIRDGFNSKDEK